MCSGANESIQEQMRFSLLTSRSLDLLLKCKFTGCQRSHGKNLQILASKIEEEERAVLRV